MPRASTPVARPKPAAILLQVLNRVDAGDTQEEIARATGLSRSRVANLARLRHLPPSVVQRVRAGTLSSRAGEELLRLTSSPARLIDLAERAEAGGWTVAELQARVDEALGITRVEPIYETPVARSHDPNVVALEQEISELLATRVSLAAGQGGRGMLCIEYFSLDELDGIVERLRSLAH